MVQSADWKSCMTTAVGRGLAASRTVLQNGAVVISKEAHTVPAVTIQVSLGAGSIYESDEQLGLSHLTSRMLDRGTERKSSDEIADALDARGVSLSLSANRHVMTIGCTCLTEDFEPMLELIAEITRQPSFPQEEIAKRKGEQLNPIRQDEDSPAVQAMQALFELLYPGGHQYGRPAKGRVDTVTPLDAATLRQFHAARFAPSTLTAIVVGDVASGRVAEVFERVFGDWKAGTPAEISLAHPPSARTRRERIITMMNKAQTDIAYGFTTIARSDPNYYAYTLMNNALGQYGIGGRLGDNIRERQGMAYYVFSSFDAIVVEGPLIVRAGVRPANVDRALAYIDEEIVRLTRDGLTEKELTESRQYLVGSMPRTLETNAGIAT